MERIRGQVERVTYFNRENGYMVANGKLLARVDGALETITMQTDALLYESENVRVRINPRTYGAEDVAFKSDTVDTADLRHAAQMGFIFQALKDLYLFKSN